jgi:hypothetical protein
MGILTLLYQFKGTQVFSKHIDGSSFELICVEYANQRNKRIIIESLNRLSPSIRY